MKTKTKKNDRSKIKIQEQKTKKKHKWSSRACLVLRSKGGRPHPGLWRGAPASWPASNSTNEDTLVKTGSVG